MPLQMMERSTQLARFYKNMKFNSKEKLTNFLIAWNTTSAVD